MGEYVTENIDKYDDGDDTIDISEYGGYSDGNEGCEVFTWGIWNYLNFGLLSEHKIQRKFWYRLKLNRGKISKNEEFWFPAEDLVSNHTIFHIESRPFFASVIEFFEKSLYVPYFLN